MKYKHLIQNFNNLRFYKDRIDHHPEANVLEHSLQTYLLAKKESYDKELWIAALFHDIGKQIDTLSHHKYSLDILESFGYYNEKVFWLIDNHIRIISWLNRDMKRFKKSQDLLHHKWFLDLVHLRRLDYGGRNPNVSIRFTEEMKIEINNLLEETNE